MINLVALCLCSLAAGVMLAEERWTMFGVNFSFMILNAVIVGAEIIK